MGILLKDQKVLYASENIGKINIDVDPTQPARVDITPSSGTLAATAGATLQLTASVLPDTAIDKGVTWRSSNSAVATVDNTGLVTRTAGMTSDSGKPFSVTITATASNGVSGDITLTAAVTAELPAGVFAVFDGIEGASRAQHQPSLYKHRWYDRSGNGNQLRLVDLTGDSEWETQEWNVALWGDNYLHCSPRKFVHGQFPNYGLKPSDGVTINALIWYDTALPGYDDVRTGSKVSYKGVDAVFTITAGGNDANRNQGGFGSRNNPRDNRYKLFHAVHSGEAWNTIYTTDAVQDLSTGVHLLTWVVNGANAKIYVDGVEVGNVTNTIQKTDDNPFFILFAPNTMTEIDSSGSNFYGKVYGVSIYNRALTAAEVGQVNAYYAARYDYTNIVTS